MDGGLGVAPEYSRTAAAAAARTAHPACVCSTQRHCVVSIQKMYNVYAAVMWIVNTAECQIWRKIMKNELNQVQMAPFGLIFDRGESYRV